MSDVLRGNFKTKQSVTPEDKGVETLEDRFEREVLRRLGGSIAFVAKKKVMWDSKDGASGTPATGTDAGAKEAKPANGTK